MKSPVPLAGEPGLSVFAHINMGEIGDSLLYYSTHEIVHAVKEISRESYEMMRDPIQ